MNHSDSYDNLRHYLYQGEDRYFGILREMVAINSFTANAAGVNQLGQYTADLFAPLGFMPEFVEAENDGYGKHLILTRPGQSDRQVAFVSHLDTVFRPEEEKRNDFHWRREGNRIYGPGTVDIKGGTLIIYMMMDALRNLLPAVFTEITWVIVLNSCEEVAEDDFGKICLTRLQPNTLACLVFEGGFMGDNQFRTVVKRKGMVTYEVQVEGKAAHAGSAHKSGANAIVQIAEIVRTIHEMTDYENNITFNVGCVAGGTVLNRVPHFATANVEMRAFDPAVFEEGINHMLALNDISDIHSANGDFSCRVQIAITRKTPPWPRNQATDSLFSTWKRAGQTLGFRVLPEKRGGLSDGNHLWQEIPTIDGLGPSGGNAHCSERTADGKKDQEFVLASSFVPKSLLNLVAVLNLITNENISGRNGTTN